MAINQYNQGTITPASRVPVYDTANGQPRTVSVNEFSAVVGQTLTEPDAIPGYSLVLATIGAPDNSVGSDGSLSVDAITGAVYKKAAGSWALLSAGAGVVALTVSGAPVLSATAGQQYAGFLVSASGGAPPYTYSDPAGSLPDGLSIHPTVGLVSGVPTTAGESGAVALVARDVLGNQVILAPFNITTAEPGSALGLSGSPVTSAQVGVPYSFSISASGGEAPYVYAVASGALPAGVTLNASTGLVSGTPTTEGTVSGIVLNVTDAASSVVSLPPFSVTVAAAAPGLAIGGTPSTSATVGVAYNFIPTATGGTAPYTFALIAGTLPAGLSFSTSTGAITGTPTTTGVASGLSIRVTDNVGATATLPSFGITVVSSGASVLPTMTTTAGFGDSVMVGEVATTPSTQGWFGVLNSSIGATGLNQGISGTVLQNSNDSGGSPRANNGRNRFLSALTGSNLRQGVFIAYGFNDARYTAAPSTFNVTEYENDLNEVIAGLRINGYAANRIFILSPYWISDTGLTTGSTGFTGQTRSGFEAFVAAAARVALAHGTWYCDIYALMRDNGGASLISSDNIHPDNAGHAVIANLVNTQSAQTNTRTASPVAATGGTEQAGYTITAASGATGYEVQRAIEGTFAFGNTVTTTSLTGTITGLTAGSYRLRARPTYAGGLYGPWAYASAAVTVVASGGGGSLVLNDTFTDVDGTALTSHTADIGGVPVVHPNFTPTGGGNAIAGNRMYMRGNAAVYIYTSATPASADYEVNGYLDCITAMTTESCGVAIRMTTANQGMVFARWQGSSGNFQLYQLSTSGTATQLGSNVPDTFVAGESRRIKLVANGTTVTMTIYGNDGTTVVGTTSGTTAIVAAGFPGLYGGMSSSTTQSPTTGTHFTRLTAGPIVA